VTGFGTGRDGPAGGVTGSPSLPTGAFSFGASASLDSQSFDQRGIVSI
jgi:hypothetical protein